MIEMKKILITGGNGFIGRNLRLYLTGKDDKYDVDAPTHRQLDLMDSRLVERYLCQHSFDIVLHTAVYGTLGMTEEAARVCQLRNNLMMFYNLKRCSDAFGKMYYYGSGAEYGKDAYQPLMKEEYFKSAVPEDDYGLSKYIMSEGIREDGNVYDLRLFGVFGPYENYNYRFVSNVVCKALCGRQIQIRRNVYFDYLYISDLCRITEWFLEHEPQWHWYNVCTSKSMDILSIARMAVQMTGSSSDIAVGQEGLGREYSGDNSRLLSEIGGFAFTPMHDALQELIAYYKSIDYKLQGSY